MILNKEKEHIKPKINQFASSYIISTFTSIVLALYFILNINKELRASLPSNALVKSKLFKIIIILFKTGDRKDKACLQSRQ